MIQKNKRRDIAATNGAERSKKKKSVSQTTFTTLADEKNYKQNQAEEQALNRKSTPFSVNNFVFSTKAIAKVRNL